MAVLISLALPIAAQTARQGEADPTEFHSPMILDTVFLANEPYLWNDKLVTGQEWTDLSKFYCDNVSIGGLAVRGKPRRDGMIQFGIEVTLRNRRGHDKEVAVRFEILSGGQVAASARLNPVEVAEGRSKTRSIPLVVPKAIVETDPKAPFRITVTARDI
jgi:hypothetical protein